MYMILHWVRYGVNAQLCDLTDSGFCTIYSLPQISSLFVSSSFFFAFIYIHVIFKKTESKKKKRKTFEKRKKSTTTPTTTTVNTRISNLTLLDF